MFSGFFFPTIIESESNKNTPIIISHGAQDPLLSWSMCEQSYSKLDKKAHSLRLELINGLAHSFNQRSLQVFKEFISQNM